jgi:hypothetical protein
VIPLFASYSVEDSSFLRHERLLSLHITASKQTCGVKHRVVLASIFGV